jgi:putative oxidoreductase
MHPLSIPFVQRLAPAAPVLLRVVVGTVMAAHGWQKLTEMGPAMFGQSMVADLGIPAPVLVGWVSPSSS